MGGFTPAPSTGGDSVFHGALVYIAAASTTVAFPVVPVPFDTARYDTDGIFNLAAKGFVIPAGFTRAKFTGLVRLPDAGASGGMSVSIRKATSLTEDIPFVGSSPTRQGTAGGYLINQLHITTPYVNVTPGETYLLRANRNLGTNPTTIVGGLLFESNPATFFSIELIK